MPSESRTRSPAMHKGFWAVSGIVDPRRDFAASIIKLAAHSCGRGDEITLDTGVGRCRQHSTTSRSSWLKQSGVCESVQRGVVKEGPRAVFV